MTEYTLTSTYSGPYTHSEGSVLQNSGGGLIFVDFSGVAPANDQGALEIPRDYDVVRLTGERTFYARSKDGSAKLKVTEPI